MISITKKNSSKIILAISTFTIVASFLLIPFSQAATAQNNLDLSQPITIVDLERNTGDGANSAGTPKDPGDGVGTVYSSHQQAGQTVNQIGGKQTKPRDEVCSWLDWGSHPINCSLLLVLDFSGALLSISATLFAWVVDVDNLKGVIDGPVIYEAWTLIRDFLNIGFILMLLFSAFATIFQVEKYSYKKVLLTIILMALLVNFSYPITRFIIDVSNSLMYTLLQNLSFGNSTPDQAMGIITQNSGIKTIMTPGAGAPTTYILAAIVFVFILAITLITAGILLIVRMIALALLIIFSPIAFVGSMVGKGGEWWKYLFEYSFFGPIMIFMISLSIKISAMQSEHIQESFKKLAEKQAVDPGIIGSMAYFAIPIVMLWMGMGVSKKMSGKGGEMALSWGKKAANYGKSALKYGVNATGVPGGIKKGWEGARKDGKLFGKKIPFLRDGQPDREAKFAGGMTGGQKGWDKARQSLVETKNKEDIKKESEKSEHEIKNIASLVTDIDTLRNKIEADRAAGKEPSREDLIKLAGMEKHAKDRGKEYDDELEKRAKATGSFTKPKPIFDNAAYEAHLNSSPLPGQEAQWEAKLSAFKAQKENLDEWKKEEKEFYQEERAKVNTKSKDTLKEAYRAK